MDPKIAHTAVVTVIDINRADTKELFMNRYTHKFVKDRGDTCTREVDLPGFGTLEMSGFNGFNLKC